ncbi:MAG TPA: dihydrodipicolinate synthase family protein [Gaiellales bacterium]|nr:dihydrodipicolinate synthase family protein [Gaiellales bacterium]
MANQLLTAAVTPLRDGGARLDEDAIGPMVEFLERGGADGVFALGTTGEGVLLSEGERRRATRAFRSACRGRLIVHCGAQTTRASATLAAAAAELGADAVAVIPPPYYPLDRDALVAHLAAVAAACAPLPVYLYAFAARSGYPLEPDVVQRVRDRVANVAGLKVSESPFAKVAPYLALGLPVYVGSEPLIPEALAAGAVGAVSGLSAAFPDAVSAVVRDPSVEGGRRLAELRAAVEAAPFVSSVKVALAARGVPVLPDVRAPLRLLSRSEADAVCEAVARLAG